VADDPQVEIEERISLELLHDESHLLLQGGLGLEVLLHKLNGVVRGAVIDVHQLVVGVILVADGLV
jgi:hypothetical protein